MNTLRKIVLALFAAMLMLLAAPAAHAAPPKGDNLADAVNIPINSTKTVKKVHLATTEPSFDATPSCDSGFTITNSVWLKFTVDANGRFDFNTGGTLLYLATSVNTRPLFAVYSYSQAIGLGEMACASFDGFISDLQLSAGEYRVVIGSHSGLPQSGSRYRLNIRSRIMNGLLVNNSFNDPLGPEWKIKHAGSPPKVFRLCDNLTDCGVRFDGVTNGKLSQKYTFDTSHLHLIKGDLLMLRAGANATPASGASVKYSLLVTYSDGTPEKTVTRTQEFTNTETTASFTILPHLVVDLASGAVKSVTATVISPDADDTFTLENLFIEIHVGAYVRGDNSPLALPPGLHQ